MHPGSNLSNLRISLITEITEVKTKAVLLNHHQITIYLDCSWCIVLWCLFKAARVLNLLLHPPSEHLQQNRKYKIDRWHNLGKYFTDNDRIFWRNI